MICFFHRSDLDGCCSGAIIKKMCPDCQMIGVDYDDLLKPFHETFLKGEIVFVVDFSFDRPDMEWLNKRCDLHWIDHHKSAMEKMEGFDCKGVRRIGMAACELTWIYLHPDKPVPMAVRLLSLYDTYTKDDPINDWDETILPFQYGMRTLQNTMPDSEVWESLLRRDLIAEDYTDELQAKGHIILEYERQQNEKYAKGMSFEAEFEGYRAIVINKALSNSKIFDSVYDPEKHDLMITFGVKPGQVKYSLYSTKPEVDVSKIAVKYSGGGHAGAAGFYSDRLLF